MKINVEIDQNLKDTEIIIKANTLNTEVENLLSILENYKNNNCNIILGYSNYNITPIELNDINYFTANGEKISMNTKKGIYETTKRLYELEKLSTDFLRISHSQIISVKEIEKLDLKYSGTILFLMKNGDELYASRRRVSTIKKYFNI